MYNNKQPLTAKGLTTFVQSTFNGDDVNKKYLDYIDPSQYIGHQAQISFDPLTMMLYTKKTVQLIQKKVSSYLIGVDSKNRTIVPSERVVIMAIYGIKKHYVPKTGDIYGRYLVVDGEERNDYGIIVDQVISLLTRGIGAEIGMEEHNSQLSIWTTVLGDFNSCGLRSHAPIKVRDRRPDPYLFSMRY